MKMYNFRKNTPVRNPNRKECKHYSSYKKTLSYDFNNRCGYCDDHDHFRISSYMIDHFVPRNPKIIDTPIPANKYSNLVWSCSYCNLAKQNKWPTCKSAIHHENNIGFMDPTEKAYSDLFIRNKSGSIIAKNDNLLGKYIIKELNLWFPVHSIIWKLEKIRDLNNEIKSALGKAIDPKFKQELESVHYELLKLMDATHIELFSKNDPK